MIAPENLVAPRQQATPCHGGRFAPCPYTGRYLRDRTSMHSTPASLLERVRRREDASSWSRFIDLYTPILFGWARRLRLQESDACDLVRCAAWPSGTVCARSAEPE